LGYMPIAILGGGNGAHALAADAALQGVPVHMYEDPNFSEHFRPTRENQKIRLVAPHRDGLAEIKCTTHHMAEALNGVSLINVVTPTAGHEAMFEALIPLLSADQTVIVWAGRFGALRLAKRLFDTSGSAKNITIAETNTLPHGSRLTGPAEVTVFYLAVRIFVGTIPAELSPSLAVKLRSFCSVAVPTRDILSAAFRNAAVIIYPAGALLNAGRVEYSGGDFYMFREGITPSVARVIRALYGEMERVGEALGLDVEHYPEEAFRPPYSIEAHEFSGPSGRPDTFRNLKGPTSIPTRYLYENLRDALAVVAELGRITDVPTPGIDAIIRLGGMLTGEDYWANRRGLETLGLSGLSADEIVKRVREGFS